jgi:hypothetical protein
MSNIAKMANLCKVKLTFYCLTIYENRDYFRTHKFECLPGLPDFFHYNIPKFPNDQNIYQMALKYTKIFHSKALLNVHKLGYSV